MDTWSVFIKTKIGNNEGTFRRITDDNNQSAFNFEQAINVFTSSLEKQNETRDNPEPDLTRFGNSLRQRLLLYGLDSFETDWYTTNNENKLVQYKIVRNIDFNKWLRTNDTGSLFRLIESREIPINKLLNWLSLSIEKKNLGFIRILVPHLNDRGFVFNNTLLNKLLKFISKNQNKNIDLLQRLLLDIIYRRAIRRRKLTNVIQYYDEDVKKFNSLFKSVLLKTNPLSFK
jgi:hypothetical protein